jgi:hypothetical protein
MSNPDAGVKDVFGKALEIKCEPDRDAFLEKACRGNPEMRAEVEDLLSAVAQAGSFMDRPAAECQVTIDQSAICECPGTMIGPYKLLQEIGEGGFGVVFMAEQQEPMHRKVALKIIKPGMDTKPVVTSLA